MTFQYLPRDWERIQKIGITSQITTPKEYASEVTVGIKLATEILELKNEIVPSEVTIKDLHYIAFRRVHPWAGKFRELGQEVEVGKHICSDSKDILRELSTLRREMLSNPLTGKRKYIIDVLSYYHASFLAIHPFLDGNGRIARLILDQQCKKLLGHPLTLNFSRAEYIKALEVAQQKGDLSLLAKIVGFRGKERSITVDNPVKLLKKREDERNKGFSVSNLEKREKALLTLRRKLGFIGSEIDALYGLGGYPSALTIQDACSNAKAMIASKAYKEGRTIETLVGDILEADKQLGQKREAVSKELITIQKALLKRKERKERGRSLRIKR